ncbi:hypothetical protein F5Y04DRAFT_285638 [Hypomontagnella monticulosa]|nr:hypothetical protein F5Y04DRAFT_285638 [Hypomontagnella monticulosa]
MATTPVQTDSSYMASGIGELIAVIVCMSALSTLTVVLRLWTRLVVQHMRLAVDDWIILFVLMLCLVDGVAAGVATRYGLSKNFASSPPNPNNITLRTIYYSKEACYIVAVTLTKVSILFFYVRVFPQKLSNILIWAMMVFVVLSGGAFTLVTIFQCTPIHKVWLPDTPGTCVDSLTLFRVSAGLAILQDFMIYLFPSPILWNVSLPVRQRIVLIGLFVVGGFVCVAEIVRLTTFKIVDTYSGPSWELFGPAVWSSIECNMGIVCASLVHIKPLIAKLAPSILDLSRSLQGRKMIKLSDTPRDLPYTSSLATFGQRRGTRPVGVLTELELEEDVSHAGVTTVTTSNAEATTFSEGVEQPNAIYTTTGFTISYNKE